MPSKYFTSSSKKINVHRTTNKMSQRRVEYSWKLEMSPSMHIFIVQWCILSTSEKLQKKFEEKKFEEKINLTRT